MHGKCGLIMSIKLSAVECVMMDGAAAHIIKVKRIALGTIIFCNRFIFFCSKQVQSECNAEFLHPLGVPFNRKSNQKKTFSLLISQFIDPKQGISSD